MTKQTNKDEFSIKKKNVPAFLSFVSIVLAIMWVAIVLSGVLREFDAESLKILTGKKIVFSLVKDNKSLEEESIKKRQDALNQENKAYVSILIELEDYSELSKLVDVLPRAVSFGMPSNKIEKFDREQSAFGKVQNNFLIQLPLVASDGHKKYDIFPNINPIELKSRLDNLLKNKQINGVYNIGSEEFLESDLQTFANVISYLNDKNLFLLYGINDKTTVFESDSENIFSVEACDELIDLRSESKEQAIEKLNLFENVAIKKGKAVLFIKSEKEIPSKILEWIKGLQAKGVAVTAFSRLPKTIRDQ